MRILVLGATGMLGTDIVDRAPPTHTVVGASRRDLDVTDADAVDRTITRERFDLVINTAAYTAVDRAEDEPALVRRVNADAVAHLAELCATRSVRLVHFSTDYVFSGKASTPYREADACQPAGAYAQTKHEGELAVVKSNAHALIVRAQWLFGRGGKSFPRTMWNRAIEGVPTRVVNDQFGSPTYTRDLATWTWDLIARDATGIIHAANAGIASWYDLATRIFGAHGASDLVSPCATAEYPTRAVRPAYSVLDTSRLQTLIGPPAPWTDALDRFLDELRAGAAGPLQ